MHISLTPAANQFLNQLLAAGYDDPAAIIETALEKMAQAEMIQAEDTEEFQAWLRQEVAIGAEQAEQGKLSPRSFEEIIAAAQTIATNAS